MAAKTRDYKKEWGTNREAMDALSIPRTRYYELIKTGVIVQETTEWGKRVAWESVEALAERQKAGIAEGKEQAKRLLGK